MAPFVLLDPQEEEELGKNRLLNIEEKSFKRVMKRVSALHSLASSQARKATNPPPETDVADDGKETPAATDAEEARLLKEEITTDFAALDSTITRLQFSMNAQKRERDRYEQDIVGIAQKSEVARETNTAKRRKLEEARATKELRKEYDVAAEKITSNPVLKPLDEQAKNISKLNEDIAEEEQQKKDIIATIKERSDQWQRFMAEGVNMSRLIKDEKEERERQEGMVEDGGAGEDENESQTPRPGLASGNATPRPDSGVAAKHMLSFEGANTPRASSVFGDRTPARDTPAPEGDSLKIPDGTGSLSVAGSRAQSRAPSPSVDGRAEGKEDDGEASKESGTAVDEDVVMTDAVKPSNSAEPPYRVNHDVTPGPDGTPQLVFEGKATPVEDSTQATKASTPKESVEST